MAETAKLLSPETEVILPSSDAGCSLVDGVTYQRLTDWSLRWSIQSDRPLFKVVYVNSSIEAKAWADIVVTSSNVLSVIKFALQAGQRIMFASDRNMGYWLQKEFSDAVDTSPAAEEGAHLIKVWQDNACVVHDQFAATQLDVEFNKWTDGPKYLIAHPESVYPVLEKADFVGSTKQMLNWIDNFPHRVGTIFVATEQELVEVMQNNRPELDIRLAPTYDGCVCNVCSFMKTNTFEILRDAVSGVSGEIINESPNNEFNELARKSINRMMRFSDPNATDSSKREVVSQEYDNG
jgi:quinolinate synthase